MDKRWGRLAKKLYNNGQLSLHRMSLARRRGHFSNFGEQEIIDKYVRTLNLTDHNRTFVDIGAGDGIRKSNSFDLLRNGWNVLGVECDARAFANLAAVYRFYPNGLACRCQVTPENAVDLLNTFRVEKDLAILSLDIDGYDYWVLDALLSAFRPRLVISEYNEKIPPPVKFVVNYSPDFTLRHHFFGYSIAKLKDLLSKHNYVLLEVEYNNVFLAPAESSPPLVTSVEQAYLDGYRNRPDRSKKFGANEDLEILNDLDPRECLEFLVHFYSKYENEYQICLED